MAEKIRIECDGRPAEVEILGEGPDVVIVGAAVPMLWAGEAAIELARRGYRVTNFDYGTGWDDPQPRSALEQSKDVLTVMASLGIDHASLLGLSRGAMTAYWQAVSHPETVDSLVLVFPVAGFADTLHLADDGAESGPATLDELLESLFSPEFLDGSRDRAMELVTSAPGSVARVDRSQEDPFPVHSGVNCRTLVIEAEDDVVVSPRHPGRYLEAVPGSEHVVLAGARHGWLMEEPAEFAEIVADFLDARG